MVDISATYKDAFNKAVAELETAMQERERLETEREAVDRRIVKLREGVLGLGALCGYAHNNIVGTFHQLFPNLIEPETGLTDATRNVLKMHRQLFLTPVQIREQLEKTGYDLSNQKNILASLHTILKRLKGQRQVLTGTRDGKTVYKWNRLAAPLGPPQAGGGLVEALKAPNPYQAAAAKMKKKD